MGSLANPGYEGRSSLAPEGKISCTEVIKLNEILEGQKYWKTGDHKHVWIVDAVEPETAERPAFAILVSEDGTATEDVDLSHLQNPNLYSTVPE
jgi:hypothetical protein